MIHSVVIPAKAGTQTIQKNAVAFPVRGWAPAFAGVTR